MPWNNQGGGPWGSPQKSKPRDTKKIGIVITAFSTAISKRGSLIPPVEEVSGWVGRGKCSRTSIRRQWKQRFKFCFGDFRGLELQENNRGIFLGILSACLLCRTETNRVA